MERGGVWTCAFFEGDRRERENEIRTIADAGLDGDRSTAAERRGGQGRGRWRVRSGDDYKVARPRPYLSGDKETVGQKGGWQGKIMRRIWKGT
jgi:hypothetical protein